MAITLRTRGDASDLDARFSARVVTSVVDAQERCDCVLLLHSADTVTADAPLDGYSALLAPPEIADQLRARTDAAARVARITDLAVCGLCLHPENDDLAKWYAKIGFTAAKRKPGFMYGPLSAFIECV